MTEANKTISQAAFIGGWCGGCGRKRGADGRCPNCDIWWNSPFLQVGAPLACVTLLAVLLLIAYGSKGQSARIASRPMSVPEGRFFYSSSPAYQYHAPATVAPPVPVANIASLPPPAPDEFAVLRARQAYLIQLSDHVDAVLRANGRERGSQPVGGTAAMNPNPRKSAAVPLSE